MACSEVLSGHQTRAPFAACAPPPKCCRPGATLQTCPDASSKGDLNVTLQLKRLIHPTSPMGSDETVSFQSFSVLNCYYFFRFYATIKGGLSSQLQQPLPQIKRIWFSFWKDWINIPWIQNSMDSKHPEVLEETIVLPFIWFISKGSIYVSHGVWVVFRSRALFQVKVLKDATGTMRQKV